MSFADQMGRARERVKARHRAVFHTIVFSAHQSITEGSPLTGSPGQPVGQYGPGYHPGMVGGTLRQSWHMEILSPTLARIASALRYARSIEDGVSYAHGGTPLTIRSSVGGTHSLQRTILNFDRLVADAKARVGRSPAFGEEGAA